MDIYTKQKISGLCINQLRDLSLELKFSGAGGFSPYDLVSTLDDHKDALESDVLLIGCDLNGVRAVETLNGKRFTFIYTDEDWLLETIEETDDSSFDGLVLNGFQTAYADIELLGILDILEDRSESPGRSVRAA